MSKPSNIFANLSNMSDDEDETVAPGKARLADKKHDGTGTSGKNLSSHKKKGVHKDRLSGTGRGKEHKKSGAGGHNWGNYKYDNKEDRKGDDSKEEESDDDGLAAEDQLTVEEFLKKNPALQGETKSSEATKLKEQFKGMQVVRKSDIDDDQDNQAPGKLTSTDSYKVTMHNENVDLLGFRVQKSGPGEFSSRGGRGGRGGFRGGRKRGGFNGGERSDRPERGERGDRAERGERAERGDGAPRGGRGGARGGPKRGGERGAKGTKPEGAAKDTKDTTAAPKKEEKTEKPKSGNFKSGKGKALDVDDATQFPSLG